ncbi:MAG: FecR family protein [Pseudomonadota bacterium]
MALIKDCTQQKLGMRLFAPLILFLSTALLSLDVSAAVAGRMLFARGDVTLLRGEAPSQAARRGTVIEVGDKIQLGKSSSAQLRFTDGALVALHEDSLFSIDSHNFDQQNPKKSEQAAELLRGGLRVITGVIGKENPESVNYRTPVATIGIRGTVYEVIYVPPEGLPGLPGVAPGHYTMVLRGRVVIASKVGDLALGEGEIGYLADEKSTPVLRPDLYSLFAKYASQSVGVRPRNRADLASGASAGEEIDGLLSEMLRLAGVPSSGPYAFVVTSSPEFGRFVTTPVTVGGKGELLSASGGIGEINSFTEVAPPTGVGSYQAGDSTIYWGSYDYMSYTPTDGIFNADYITATQVLLTTDDLPTIGSYTYNYVGGSGASLDPTSHLTVDFASGTMDVALDTTFYGTWSASGASISSFYADGMSLTNPTAGDGIISGRFVGTTAEGAISAYALDIQDGYISGVAAFAR